MITHAQLLELVHYDPDTGIFTLLKDIPNGRKAGTVMNRNACKIPRPDATPVRATTISVWHFGTFGAGPLAYFYMTGKWPPRTHEMDHHDNDGWNQRWPNLRLATHSQNQANTRRYKSNSSGFKCVFPSGRKSKPWRAQIQKDKRRISLGYFHTPADAFTAVLAASATHHGEFARPW